MMDAASSLRSEGISTVIGIPMTSSAEYPNSVSELAFQLVIFQSSVSVMIASGDSLITGAVAGAKVCDGGNGNALAGDWFGAKPAEVVSGFFGAGHFIVNSVHGL
jgi:hypothetical protein